MPAQFTKHFVQDLTQDIKIRQCGTIVFNADNESNVISVDLYNGTEEYSGGGSVAGACICPDGSTVALTGSISGKTASVVLTGDCFAFPGQIGIGVQVVSGTVKTTVLKAVYNVELFETDDMVDPGSRITASVGQLVADIEAATAEIPASDMASLMSGIAPTFSDSTAYPAGAYSYYNGTLYKFTSAHAAGSWTGTDATQVDLGNDLGSQVCDLKNAVDANNITPVDALELHKGNLSTSTTWNNINDNYLHVALSVSPGDSVKLKAASDTINIAFVRSYSVPALNDTIDYSAQEGFTGRLSVGTSGSSYTVPSDVHYLVMMLKVAGYTRTLSECDVNGYNYLLPLSKIITNIISDVNASETELDNLKEETVLSDFGYNLTALYESGYIDLSGEILSQITTTPTPATNRDYIIIPCKKNDAFLLSGYGPSSSVRLFGFTDATYHLYTRAVSNITHSNALIFAPIDGYFISNVDNTQPYALHVKRNDHNSAEKADITNSILNACGYITTNVSVNTTISFDPVRGVSYAYAIIPCKKNDIFTITGEGANAARLWAFTDGNRVCVSVSGTNEVGNGKRLVAPCDGYFVYNSKATAEKTIIIDRNVDVISDANDVSQVAMIVDHTSDYKGGFINCNQAEGTVIDTITSHNNWVNCTFPVSAGDYIQVTGTTTSRDGRLWAFLDKDKKLLSVSRYAEIWDKYLVQANADGYFVTSARNEYTYGVVQIKNGKSIGRVSKENAERDRYYYLRMGNIGLANTPRYIRMCNCYGNPENVHPKVLYIESGFGGHPYWMAYTPYPSGDTQYENPCVAWSDDGFIWNGISANPLATMVNDGTTNYNSDTHLVLHGTTLECWYRWVDDTNNIEVIYRRTSTDGVTWTAAEEMLRSTGAKSYLLSPVVVWDSTNSRYRMWVVSSQGGYAIKYYESNTAGTTWTEIRRIDLTYANNSVDYRPWHMDLILDGNNYIALVMCKDTATTNTDWPLFITTSADNVTYTTPYAVMLGNEYGWDQMLYRSTIVKIGSKYRIYYSAKSRANRYGIGITEGNDIKSFVGCFDRFDAFA